MKLKIWTDGTGTEFAISVDDDAVMRFVTAGGILYPRLVDTFQHDKASSIDEVFAAWVTKHRGD